MIAAIGSKVYPGTHPPDSDRIYCAIIVALVKPLGWYISVQRRAMPASQQGM